MSSAKFIASTWVILAGGRSQRMGQIDKGLVQLHGRTMVERIIEQLHAQGADVAINANANIDLYKKLAPTFSDIQANFMGPLAGMLAAFDAYPDQQWLGFVACDVPFLPAQFVSQMQPVLERETQVVVAQYQGRMQPVFNVMHRSVVDELQEFLIAGERKVGYFIKRQHHHSVNFDDAAPVFNNINSKLELQQLEASL